jgi:CubicO group peptidase (beta-lactamase class C family)
MLTDKCSPHQLAQTRRVLLLLVVVGLLAGCGGSGRAAPTPFPTRPAVRAEPDVPWPTDGWQTAEPEALGMDAGKLAAMLEDIRVNLPGLRSVLVIRHGYIVSETYFGTATAEQSREIYSVTKSFIATLIGIAKDQGVIPAVDTPIADLLPAERLDQMDDTKRAITLQDALTMRMGLSWNETDWGYVGVLRAEDSVQYMFNLPLQSEPGTEFLYCSGCSHVLSAVIQARTGQTAAEFAADYLFAPLGIGDVTWEASNDGTTLGGWGLKLTPREMAKLGYLYLHEGAWDGQQVVSPEWGEAATTQQTAADGDLGYGYQWWIHPRFGGYAALGRGGQMVYVAPEKDLVFVATADDLDHGPLWQLIEDYVLPAAE